MQFTYNVIYGGKMDKLPKPWPESIRKSFALGPAMASSEMAYHLGLELCGKDWDEQCVEKYGLGMKEVWDEWEKDQEEMEEKKP
jgi:hypothetical protein